MKIDGVDINKLETPSRFMEFALRRTRPMMKAWMLTGKDSFNELLAAIYLQGVKDGLQTAEYNYANELEEKVEDGENDVEN
jgi:hypothetical protein